MSIVTTDDKHYKNITAKIREKTYSSKSMRPDEIPDGIEFVYETGKIDGVTEGYAEGWNDGEQSEYDRFWDVFQSKGNRVRYNYAFAHGMWNDETFKPKYDIKPISAQCMFAYNNNEGSGTTSENYISDLTSCFEKTGTILDTSNASDLKNVFYMGRGFARIPPISFESCTFLDATFYGCIRLETIDKLILKKDGTNTFQTALYGTPFGQCTKLKNIVIEGVIGDSINFNDCPLSKASILSVFNALSPVTAGKTATFKKVAKEAAFTDDEWSKLTAAKPNWTISLV